MTDPDTPTAGDRHDGDALVVSPASASDWAQVVEWAADENWNPGLRDAACFRPTDPAGFFVGRLGGRPVSAISVVRYSDRYAFLGHYLVRPGLRGRGLGLATWRAAVPHAGARTIGLDAVPEQEATYGRSGFVSAHRSIRYGGVPARRGAPPLGDAETSDGVVPETGARLDAVTAYDARCFPAERRAFLGCWLAQDGHVARVRLRDGAVRGYGVIRPARSGYRVGPLFADTPDDADALLDALLAQVGPDARVTVDVPEEHAAARALVEARSLEPEWHTVRMYAGGTPPPGSPERVFAGTSLELG